MFQDFREHEDGAVFETDLCVVGAGAAGITLARAFVGAGREVLLLEGGNLEPEGPTLALSAGDIVGAPYPPLEDAHLRYFGGSTNAWGGHCRPLDPIDFEARPWVPHSGWPMTRQDLDPYYARAQEICELGPFEYALQPWEEALPSLVGFDAGRIVNRLWQQGPPTRFGERYGDELKQAEDIKVLFNANAVEILVNDAAAAVTEVAIKTLEGKTGRVRPRNVVLAMGGIENTRLLLASNSTVESGVGNGHDLVGRYFMEHPHALIAFAVPSIPIDSFAAYYVWNPVSLPHGEATIRISPGLSEDVQRAERLPNACLDMGYGYDRSEGYLALREVGTALTRGKFPEGFGRSILDMVSDPGGLASGVRRRLSNGKVLWFGANAEQVPNPESRVTLSEKRDALGMPQVRLDWRLTRQDKEAARRTCRIVGEELARLGIARMHLDAWLLEENDDWRDLGVRNHEIGTTRMSDDPRHGVVDRNARVHGIGNLYVAGSSVFPTSGYANPTLTIVALALRLADHLKTVSRN